MQMTQFNIKNIHPTDTAANQLFQKEYYSANEKEEKSKMKRHEEK